MGRGSFTTIKQEYYRLYCEESVAPGTVGGVLAESTWLAPVPVGRLVFGGITSEFTETESLPDDSVEFELLQDAKQKIRAARAIVSFMIN